MKQIVVFFENRLLKPMQVISKNKYIYAIREGIVSAFPLTLIGSLFMLLAAIPFPESWALHRFMEMHRETILIPYRMTALLITLYVVTGIGASLASQYKLSSSSGSIVSLATFLMTIIPSNPISLIPDSFLESSIRAGLDISWASSLESLDWVIPIKYLGGLGLYVGILSAIVGVELMRFFHHWLTKRISSERRGFIFHQLLTILPIASIVVIMFILRDVCKFDIQAVFVSLVSQLIQMTGTLSGALLFCLFMSFASFFGVGGITVHHSTARFAWVIILHANMIAHTNGQPLPNVATLPFFQFFVWIGGAGTILSLVILCCFSKSRSLKRLGYSCIVPSAFNLSEPFAYGMPVLLNPYFLIPFFVAPLVVTIISYLAISLNIVGHTFVSVAKMIPAPIGAFLATKDLRAVLLCLVNLFVSGLIYYPFFKLYEGVALANEQKHTTAPPEDAEHISVVPVD